MSERSQLLYCQDILESGAAILSYVQGITCDALFRIAALLGGDSGVRNHR